VRGRRSVKPSLFCTFVSFGSAVYTPNSGLSITMDEAFVYQPRPLGSVQKPVVLGALTKFCDEYFLRVKH
jgi:hypothetical protein